MGRNESAPCQGFARGAKRLDGVTAGFRFAEGENPLFGRDIMLDDYQEVLQ